MESEVCNGPSCPVLKPDGGREQEDSPLTPSPIAAQVMCFGFQIAPLVSTQREAPSLNLLPPIVVLVLIPLVTTGGGLAPCVRDHLEPHCPLVDAVLLAWQSLQPACPLLHP